MCKTNLHTCSFQDELINFANTWNGHRIVTRDKDVVGGRPVLLYTVPELYATENFGRPVDVRDSHDILEECVTQNLPCDEDVFNICVLYMEENRLQIPADPYQTVDLYINLRDHLLADLDSV